MTGTELRPLAAGDVAELARLHSTAFPGFFLSSLGEAFLTEFYRGFLHDDSAVAVVAQSHGGSLTGAAVGTLQPAGFFQRLLRRQWPGFVRASLVAVARDPRVAPRLLRAVRYRGGSPGGRDGALLSSIYVVPGAQGTGLGHRLLEEWTDQVRARGAATAYLTTDAQGNDDVNAFYAAHGWTVTDHVLTPERRSMNRYTKRLDAP